MDIRYEDAAIVRLCYLVVHIRLRDVPKGLSR
jgi:hypothetical protein